MAAHESTTQPIICCIGASVAGQPTQFLLERAFSHLHLPWRALSVEFDDAKFTQVCEAMLAMGFRGLRFYGDFEQSAAQLLATNNQPCQFIGQVTSAAKSADQWTVWNNRGAGWMELLQLHQATSIWLHGDCSENRSLAMALIERALSWIWTDAPREACEASVDEHLKPIVRTRLFESQSPPQAEQIAELLSINESATDSNARVTQSFSHPRIGFVTNQATIPSEFSNWLVELNSELITSAQLKLPESLMTSCVCKVSAADLAVAAEASDFKRWTGQSIDSSILRDAYDEFCDF
ncbi:MAG: hypothetical protein U0930_15635 [Pirellulales bacterium]